MHLWSVLITSLGQEIWGFHLKCCIQHRPPPLFRSSFNLVILQLQWQCTKSKVLHCVLCCCFCHMCPLLRTSQFPFSLQCKRTRFAGLFHNVKFLKYYVAVSQRRPSCNYAFTSNFSYFYTLHGFWPSPSPDFIQFTSYNHHTLRYNHKVVLYSTKILP